MVSETKTVPPDQWVDACGDYLYQYALARLHSPQRAEDAVQETFLAALKGYKDYDARASLKTWLTGILKHKIIDQIRKSTKEVPLLENPELGSIDDLFDRLGHAKTPAEFWKGDPRAALSRAEFWERFHQCLAKLSRPLADAFTLREIEGLDRDEICKVLGITATNYWVMLHRARLKLRECLEKNWFLKGKKGA